MRASKSMCFPDGRGSIVVIRSRPKARNCQNCTMFMYVKYAEDWRLEQFQIFQAQLELQLQKVGQCLYLLAKNTHSLAWRKEIQTTCRIYQKDFSYFTGPNLFCSEKIIKGEPPNIKRRPSKQSQISEGTGSKEEDRRREAVIREFVGEYGKGVRQENVCSKTKELTCTLPYALSMRPSVITASSEDCHDVTKACQIEDANVVLQDRTVRVQTVDHNKDVVAVRQNRRRKISPFWRLFFYKTSN